ncbi:MAG: thioredoxin domain-containing protein, partial [Gammaproteobacteria bacterium]
LYAEAAARQGMFWQMHDFLFANQAIWSGLPQVEEEFDSYARQLNLDLAQLHADMELDEVLQKIRNDQRGGNISGVRSTPTLFINGRNVGQPTAQRIVQIVADEYGAATAGAD